MKIKKYITKELDIDIKGITLLSIEEYEASRPYIRLGDNNWWLRSPSAYNDCAAYASSCGYMDGACDFVIESCGVRPALKITSSDLSTGDRFNLFEQDWTVISDEYALCDYSIGRYCFRKDCYAEDANDYEASDVKKFLEDWFEEQMEGVE